MLELKLKHVSKEGHSRGFAKPSGNLCYGWAITVQESADAITYPCPEQQPKNFGRQFI